MLTVFPPTGFGLDYPDSRPSLDIVDVNLASFDRDLKLVALHDSALHFRGARSVFGDRRERS